MTIAPRSVQLDYAPSNVPVRGIRGVEFDARKSFDLHKLLPAREPRRPFSLDHSHLNVMMLSGNHLSSIGSKEGLVILTITVIQ